MTGSEPRHINPNEAGTESREAQSAWICGGRAQPILSASMPVTKTLSTPAMSPTMNSTPMTPKVDHINPTQTRFIRYVPGRCTA